MHNSQYFISILCMLISMLSYQLSASFAKQLFQSLDPLTVSILRLSFAFILVCLMFRSWHIIPKIKQLLWTDLILYSICLGTMNVLFYFALNQIPLGVAVGLEFIGPLTLALLAVQRKQDYIWVILAILGIIGLVPWQAIDHFSLLGAFLAIGAGTCWAGYIHFGQRIVKQDIGMHGLTIAIAISTLYLLPLGLWHDADTLFQVQYWKMGFLIALLATAIPYALDLYALKFLNKMTYGTLTSLSPALAASTGFLILNESLSIWQLSALSCIILASIGITLFTKHNE